MPASLVTSARSACVFVFRTETAAEGTTPPVASVMVPVMVPAPVVCAASRRARQVARARERTSWFCMGDYKKRNRLWPPVQINFCYGGDKLVEIYRPAEVTVLHISVPAMASI